MSVFDLFRRGPKTTEFWGALLGTLAGVLDVKLGGASIGQTVGLLSPLLVYIGGRSALKVAAAMKAGDQAGEAARAAAKAVTTPDAPAGSSGSGGSGQ